jgi:hypothetical protein
MGQRNRQDDISELDSLGIRKTTVVGLNDGDLEDLIDDAKQEMIRQFRAAYVLTEQKQNPKATIC